MKPARSAKSCGFTLVEVLVALAIVAVALAAGLQASGALTRHVQRHSDMVLAQLCAENELVRLRLQRRLPDTGDTETPCEQAGQSLTLTVSVRTTPNPNFRRVDAKVSREASPIWRLTTILGRY